MVNRNEDVHALGAKVDAPTAYTAVVLEKVPHAWRDTETRVKLICSEFTSLCPVTGQPDFATVYIEYVPRKWLVESKSLKLYLTGFRNHGAFHEDCIESIAEDLNNLLRPQFLQVRGEFVPRGGIAIWPTAVRGYEDE